MDKEILLANTQRAPDDVAVIADQKGGYLFAWSVDAATFVSQSLPKDAGFSHPTAQPAMIPRPGSDERDGSLGQKAFWPSSARASIQAEDLDLIPLKGGKSLIVMLELPTEASTGGAFAALISPDGKPKKTVLLGPAGEYATEISAVLWDDQILVAWHDGTLNASRLHLTLSDAETLELLKSADFRGKGAVASPTLALAGNLPVIAWSETGNQGSEAVSHVNTARVSRDLKLNTPKTVADGRFIFPSPNLITQQSGLGLVFRDDADKDDTPEFYFLALNDTGAPAAEKKRISQADGLKGPSLDIQGDFFVSAAIRSFQRNLLIGLNRFDKQGVKQNGEFQVYADKTDFVRVDIASANDSPNDSLMMIYAEDKRTSGRVLAGRIFCGEKK